MDLEEVPQMPPRRQLAILAVVSDTLGPEAWLGAKLSNFTKDGGFNIDFGRLRPSQDQKVRFQAAIEGLGVRGFSWLGKDDK